jgi:hypothetical protein
MRSGSELRGDERPGCQGYNFDANGRVLIEAKDDARKRLGRSPDRADALVLALGNGVSLRGETPIVSPYETPYVPFYEPHSIWEGC